MSEAPPPAPGEAAAPAASAPTTDTPDAKQRQMGMFIHLSALLMFVTSIPSLVFPLIFWLVKKDESPFYDAQGKEALNFNISVAIYALALTLFGIVALGFGFLIAVPLLIALGIAQVVFVIIAAIKTNEGKSYVYPMTLRLIK